MRKSWRSVVIGTKNAELDEDYKNHLAEQLSKSCKEILDLLENNLITQTQLPFDAKTTYMKMAGDYYCYLAEVSKSKTHERKADYFYGSALELAQEHLEATNALRLSVCLNYSVYFWELQKKKEKAMALAKDAFDEAIPKLEDLDEDAYKDSTLIMQLLRDNLTLWSKEHERLQQRQSK
jgi:hypothetical protein